MGIETTYRLSFPDDPMLVNALQHVDIRRATLGLDGFQEIAIQVGLTAPPQTIVELLGASMATSILHTPVEPLKWLLRLFPRKYGLKSIVELFQRPRIVIFEIGPRRGAQVFYDDFLGAILVVVMESRPGFSQVDNLGPLPKDFAHSSSGGGISGD